VGLSNFQVDHLQRVLDECDVVPAVNQIELHPYFQNREVASFCEQNGIAVEAWSPIAQGDVLDDAVLGEIAGATGKSVAQVVLRWHIQKGYIVFPKSTTPERIEENFKIFDFELSDEQMGQIDGLDRGEEGRRGPNPDQFAYVPS
jgi:2,5-diketo-D-gluconate reductase A